MAPLSGILMCAATASTTAGATIASASFAPSILGAGVAATWGAAMINAGATVLDHLPHGSFFHATGGAVGMGSQGIAKTYCLRNCYWFDLDNKQRVPLFHCDIIFSNLFILLIRKQSIIKKHYETEKLIITFFLITRRFRVCTDTIHPNYCPPRFWKTNGSAQNSIAALMKADSVGCYGSEFDVWLTDDDQLVVNWSSVFKGVNMQESTVKECTAIVLDNGEHLPTLQEYLEKARNLKTRLILELKAHKTREQETRAVKRF